MSGTPDTIRITCPNCNAVLEADGSIEGSRIECPECGGEFVAVRDKPEIGKAINPRSKKKRAIGIVLLAVALLFMLSRCSGEKTVADFRSELVRKFNGELASPGSPLRKRIERAHGTVTVKSAHVVRCDLATFDGSNRAGENGENIRGCNILLRFEWEGVIDKGYTDLRAIYDGANDRWHAEIDYTTAAINFEDPEFWGSVMDGFVAGWNYGEQMR